MSISKEIQEIIESMEEDKKKMQIIIDAFENPTLETQQLMSATPAQLELFKQELINIKDDMEQKINEYLETLKDTILLEQYENLQYFYDQSL